MHRAEISSTSSLDVSFKNVVDYIVIVFYFLFFLFFLQLINCRLWNLL